MICFVTGNRHKYEEAKKLLSDIEMRHIPYPEIQADSLEEVAEYGIEFLRKKLDCNFFLEDSGLFISHLNGFPGVYSAYVFKTIGNDGILKLMKDAEDREARFESVIAYYDGEIHLFKGVCKGMIAENATGKKGFGYDPIFIPEGEERTFAEMESEEKNEYSHRGMAMKKFISYLSRY